MRGCRAGGTGRGWGGQPDKTPMKAKTPSEVPAPGRRLVLPRRTFLKGAGAGALAGLGDFGFLGGVPRVTAAEGTLEPGAVRFGPEIEPLVRLLEETPRERLLEEVAARLARGTTYREVLAALLLAGVRNIQPRPVGFKFHAVLVVNSAHLASQNSPEADRWLPIFWALDYFKGSQARDVQEGDWTMQALDEGAVPEAGRARAAFVEAMDRWDEPAADLAVAGLARTAGAQEIFDLMCRYGARDFRDIGHKAIYVANSWRTLQNIGWHHAEPVLRSLAYALLEHEGGNPAERDAEADRPGRENLRRLRELRADWQGGLLSAEASREMLECLRRADPGACSRRAVELVNGGVSPQSLWDAYFQHAGEMLMRRPGIITLHACTTANALHYCWQHAGEDETRRFLLLQCAAFLPMFRDRAGAGEGIDLVELEPLAVPESEGEAVAEIFADVSGEKLAAARKTLGFLRGREDARPFIDAAQRLIYLKGSDSHDYKFSSAVLEDFRSMSPGLRERYLAASVYWLKGSGQPDTPLVARTRAALA